VLENTNMNKPSPFTPLHPTLKKCKCGYIGTRSQLYKHFDSEAVKHANDAIRKIAGFESKFTCIHGEVPLRANESTYEQTAS
jgi:hypothetical protein